MCWANSWPHAITRGLLYVGDCKMAAVQTRASIQAQGDYYLCPLSALQVSPAQIAEQVQAQRAQAARLVQVERADEHGKRICIAQGYETIQTLTVQMLILLRLDKPVFCMSCGRLLYMPE